MYQRADALHLDDQSLSRMRVRMRLLLRQVHSRFPGTARSDGLRAPHLRETDGCRGVVAHLVANADWNRRDSDRNGDRPLSAGGAQIPPHALDAGSVRLSLWFESVDHHQVRSGDARLGSASADKSAVPTPGEFLADNSRPTAAADHRTARAAARSPASCAARAG